MTQFQIQRLHICEALAILYQ